MKKLDNVIAASFAVLLILFVLLTPSMEKRSSINYSSDLIGHAIHPLYPGFALPINTFSSVPNVAFTSSTEQKILTFSTSDTVVYKTAYVSLDGKSWFPVTLSGNPYSGSSVWISGQAIGSLNVNISSFGLSSLRTSSTNNFIISYSCTWTNNAWDCHNNTWQIRQYNATLTLTPTCNSTVQCVIAGTGPKLFDIGVPLSYIDFAVIKWTTYERSTSQVFYGETTALGSSTLLDQSLASPHSAILPNLKPGTTYYYKVQSMDKDNALFESQILSFTTQNTAIFKEFYVSLSGSDSNTGTINSPFATLEKARDAIRTFRQSNACNGNIYVWIRAGTYYRTSTFALTSADSGTASCKIIYSAYPGENVVFSGGKPVNGFSAVTGSDTNYARLNTTVRNNIMKASLTSNSITIRPLQSRPGSDFEVYNYPQKPITKVMGSELFFKNNPAIRSRYPNTGTISITGVVDSSGLIFKTSDTRPRLWSSFDNIWVDAWLTVDYYGSYKKISSINLSTMTIDLLGSTVYGGGAVSGQWFYYVNVLEELDMPNEYYIDEAISTLYYYPPSTIQNNDAVISLLPTLAEVNASNTIFKDMIFGETTQTTFIMRDTTNTWLVNMTLRNSAVDGLLMLNTTNSGIFSSKIKGEGAGGIFLDAGDRHTLTNGNNIILNNEVTAGRLESSLVGTPINVMGVGNLVSHNLVHDSPYLGIYFYGNNHVIEYNELYDLVRESDDGAAIYTYSELEWASRGSIVKYNYIHDLSSPNNFAAAIYIDASNPGIIIYGNVLSNISKNHVSDYNGAGALMINGGRDTIIENNIVTDTHRAIHEVESIGTVTGYNSLIEYNYLKPQYSLFYPEAMHVTNTTVHSPEGTVISHNIFYNYKGNWFTYITNPYDRNPGNINTLSEYIDVHDNLIGTDPHFVNYASRNYQLQDDSPAYALGFKKIPFEKIGICDNTWTICR